MAASGRPGASCQMALVLEHPSFAWLRQLSALIARLDEWMRAGCDQLGRRSTTRTCGRGIALRDLISAEHRTGIGPRQALLGDRRRGRAVLVEHRSKALAPHHEGKTRRTSFRSGSIDAVGRSCWQ